MPPNDVIQGCGSKVHVIENMLNDSKDRVLSCLHHHNTKKFAN